MEIGWTKPTEVPADWDDAKIKAANFNSRALNALLRNSRRYPLLKLLSKHGLFFRQPMKELRLSRIQNFRDLLQALKRSRWRGMSRSMSSMPSLRT